LKRGSSTWIFGTAVMKGYYTTFDLATLKWGMTPHQTSTKKHVIAGVQPTQEISTELNLWLEYAAYAASGASMYLIYEYVLAGLYRDPFLKN